MLSQCLVFSFRNVESYRRLVPCFPKNSKKKYDPREFIKYKVQKVQVEAGENKDQKIKTKQKRFNS